MSDSQYADVRVGAPSSLDTVRARRAGLRAAMLEMEARLAAPLHGRAGAWAAEVHSALAELTRALSAHVEATEGADGLLATVRHEAPRLSGPVERLGVEHVVLTDRVTSIAVALQAAGDDVLALAAVRERLTDLLGALTRHRQRGADLLYEAYDVDIGGE